MKRSQRQRGIRAVIAVASMASALAVVSHSVFAADIAIRAQAAPQGAVVRLGDVAEVSAESSQEAQRLAATPLMPAPAPGTERFLRMREVRDLLAAHGENLDQLCFKGELTVAIGSPATLEQPKADSSTVDAQLDSQAARRAAWTLGNASVGTTATPTEGDVSQARGELNRRVADYLNRSSGQNVALLVKCNLPSQQLALLPTDSSTWKVSGGIAPWTGKQRILVSFVSTHGEDSFTMPVDVSLPVAVAIRPLERGAVLTAADVELQPRDVAPGAQGRSAPFTSIEKLVGMEATRSIQTGDVVMADVVQSPVLVKRGDSVTVFARGGGIQVRTIARARENGSLGQPVQVESLETHKAYDAVVTGTREAVVFAGSAAPPAETVSERSHFLRR